MGRNRRGFRDGTGPRRGSYQDQNAGTGKRQQSGEPCPTKTPSNLGKFIEKRSGA